MVRGLFAVRTVEVGRSDKGDVNTKVSVVGGAVQAQVDAKGH